jgi:hypothetical protein
MNAIWPPELRRKEWRPQTGRQESAFAKVSGPSVHETHETPAPVSCAVPSKWISVQDFAVASQKFTCPVLIPMPLSISCTVAVRVITLPDVTEVTALPPEVTARLVVVRALVTAKALLQAPLSTITVVSHAAINPAGRLLQWKRNRLIAQLTNKRERTMAAYT